MKCYEITDGEIKPGIDPELVRYSDPAMIDKETCRIMDAGLCAEIDREDELGIEKLHSESRGDAFALAFIELKPADKKSKTKDILVAFNPAEYIHSARLGDESDIVYRSVKMLVVRAYKGKMFIVPHASEDDVIVNDGEPVVKRLSALEHERSRVMIEQRRKTTTRTLEVG